jgi:hypothetical protein
MQFTAYPLKGVNDIEFGMTAQMVGDRVNSELEIGDFRSKSPNHPTYYYPNELVFFYFDEDGHLEGIEFCYGSNVQIGDINLLNLPVRSAISALTKIDPQTLVDDEGAVSHRLSIGIWCPNLGDEEDEEPVETLLIGRFGYFDDQMPSTTPSH